MEEKFIQKEDFSIYYRVYGAGKPVLLMHGLGVDGTVWDQVAELLQKKYRVIVPDIPGSGRSTRKDEPLTIETMAEEINSLVTEEGLEGYTMIGHSMSGYITLAFAEKYPDKLGAFGLFHSTTYADTEEKKAARRKNIDFINKNGAAKYLGEAIPGFFGDEFRKSQPVVIKELIERYANFLPASLVRYNEAMIQRPERTSVLEKFRKPILFIAGEMDSIIPIDHLLKQCKIPEIAYIYVCAHSGHMGMLEEPEFSAKAIDDFLSYDEIG